MLEDCSGDGGEELRGLGRGRESGKGRKEGVERRGCRKPMKLGIIVRRDKCSKSLTFFREAVGLDPVEVNPYWSAILRCSERTDCCRAGLESAPVGKVCWFLILPQGGLS